MSPSILLVRRPLGLDGDAPALESVGFRVIEDPYLRIATCIHESTRQAARRILESLTSTQDWLIVTSPNGVRACTDLLGRHRVRELVAQARDHGARFAAVGPASAAALVELGAQDVLVPSTEHTARALLELLATDAPSPARAYMPRSAIADGLLPNCLRARGWQVIAPALYRTTAVITPPATASLLASGEFDAVVLRSPSAVHAVLGHAKSINARVIAGGPTTAVAASRAGLRVDAVSRGSTSDDIARVAAALLGSDNLVGAYA